MQQHLQTLIHLLTKNDLKALLQHYLNSSELENVAQLGFMFQQAQIKSANFNYYQQLATSFIETKGLPVRLIAKIKTNNTLNFFTPALQIQNNFIKIDHQQCNVLHYLFSHNELKQPNYQPPFNYLRSMLLFGSNNALCNGLSQRQHQNLTPIEAYLLTNINLAPLANHELTALLALIEIESKNEKVNQDNYPLCLEAVSRFCQEQALLANQELQRIILIAAYYKRKANDVTNDIQQNIN